MYKRKDKNYLQNMSDYIKNNLNKGYTKESLKWALINQGHSRVEVEKALNLVNIEMTAKEKPLNKKPELSYEPMDIEIEEKKSFWQKLFG